MSYFEKTAVNGLNDVYGFNIESDIHGQLSVAEGTKLVGAAFSGTTTDTNFWTVATSGTGSVADTGATTPAYATLSSGTSNSGYGTLTSVRKTWFVPAKPLKFHGFTTLTNLTVANTTRSWGAMSISGTAPQDGFYFSVNGSGVLSVNAANAGTITSVASGSFNGQAGTSFTLDTNQHHYDILFGVFGAYFFIDEYMIHFIKQTTAPLASTYSLPVSALSVNSASGTASATLQIGMIGILRCGMLLTAPKSYYSSASTAGTVLKYGAGVLHRFLIGAPSTATTITLYDNTSASGTILYSATFPSGGSPIPTFIDFGSLPFFIGLTVAINQSTSVTLIYE